MASTGLRSTLSSAIVKCALEVLQSSALSQVGQARILQGPGLGGFSNGRSVKCIHIAAAKLFLLLRRKGLGAVLLVNARRTAVPVTSVFTLKPGGLRGPLTIRTSTAESLLPHSDAVSTEPVDRSNRP